MAKTKTRPSLGAESSTSASASRPTKPKSKSKSTKGTTSEAGKLYSSFLPLPLSLPSPVPITSTRKAKTLTSSSSVTHYLFVRPHAPRAGSSEDERAAADRTLFVANVPVDGTARSLRGAFGRFGVVEDVVLASGGGGGEELEKAVRGIAVESDSEDEDEEDVDDDNEGIPTGDEPKFLGTGGPLLPRSKRPRRKPNTLPPSVPEISPLPPLDVRTPYGASGARTARVVFVDAVSVPRAMAYTGAPIPLKADSDEPTGLALYEAQYTALRPPLAAVRTHADTAMARHDHLHSLLLASRAKQHGAGALVDEDGFTVVVRGGRYGRTAGRKGDPGGAGVGVAKRGFAGDQDGDKRKKGRGGAGELGDFYKFQMVDRKRKELAQLRARFEDDKKKVDELKKSRRFKPY